MDAFGLREVVDISTGLLRLFAAIRVGSNNERARGGYHSLTRIFGHFLPTIYIFQRLKMWMGTDTDYEHSDGDYLVLFEYSIAVIRHHFRIFFTVAVLHFNHGLRSFNIMPSL